MGNLKTLRGLLACIAFLESTSSNIPMPPERTTGTTRILSSTGGADTCVDKAECSKYRLPLDCTRHHLFRQNCQASCNMCPRGTYKTIRMSTRKVSSLLRLTTVSMRVASVTVSSGVCKDDNMCTIYKDLHRRCSGTDGWYRQHCRLSCNMCITGQMSVTREISPTSTTSPVSANQVIVQEHDDVSLASSHTRHMTASKRLASVTAVSGACKDDKYCTRFKNIHLLCSGAEHGWYREHCRLSCNTCITDQGSVTRDVSHTSTTSPVRSTNVSVQVHDDVTLAPSHPQRTVVTTWIPSSAGDGQNMEWVMNNIAVTVLTPILVILVIVIIVITKIKVSGRKDVLTPQREQSKVVVTYSGVTPEPEKQTYTAIDLEAHTYSSVDDIKHETEDYQNINDCGSQHIGMN